jgi:hypothetical protein
MFRINVFIDTQVFIAHDYGLGARHFDKLAELVQTGKIQIFTTPITNAEIKHHIQEDVSTGISRLRSDHKNFTGVRLIEKYNRDSFVCSIRRLDVQTLVTEISREFDKRFKALNPHELPIDNVSLSQLFTNYFDQIPPFSGGDKKYEFPDAVVLLAIEQWCNSNGQAMYVISADPDFGKACANSSSLRYFEKLDEFLDFVVEEYDSIMYGFANDTFIQFESKICDAIALEFKDLDFFIDRPAGHVSQVEVRSVQIVAKSVISVSSEWVIMNVTARVEYTASVSFADIVARDVILSMTEEVVDKKVNIEAEVEISLEEGGGAILESVLLNETEIVFD